MTSLPVNHVHSCGCRWTPKIQVQMKTKASNSLTALKAERNTFTLPTCIWLVFPLLNALSGSKQLIWLRHVFSRMQYYRASAVEKIMKIEPPMISFMIRHHPRWQTKMMILSQWKAANLSLFFSSFKWMTRGQNVGNSQQNLRNGRVKLNSSTGRVFVLI